MWIALAIILALAWLLGFSVFNIASATLHILLVLAAISLLIFFVKPSRTIWR
jgi:hypothetical protein